MKVESAADTASIAAANRSANCTVSRALRDLNGRIGSVIRHRHLDRWWSEPNLKTHRALRGSDFLMYFAAWCAQQRVPDDNPGGRVRRVIEGRDPLPIRSRRPSSISDDDERAHLVVNVAPKCHDPGFVEMNCARLILGEKLQLELLCRRK